MNECAFDRGSKCSALKEKDCWKCSFRKTQKQLEAGRKKAVERINNLPRDTQTWIREKYYTKQRHADE